MYLNLRLCFAHLWPCFLSRFYAVGYFLSTEYEEFGLSVAELHIRVVDGSVFNPRTGICNVFRFVDKWYVRMTKILNFPRLDFFACGHIDFVQRILSVYLQGGC